tara:strand:+ start:1057 stop:1257 length:201 start_codon:yes stop_codon:yes gene_type:complete
MIQQHLTSADKQKSKQIAAGMHKGLIGSDYSREVLTFAKISDMVVQSCSFYVVFLKVVFKKGCKLL